MDDPSFQPVRCAECGVGLPASEMIQLSGQWVCARCKPQVVQRMKEGVFEVNQAIQLPAERMPFFEIISAAWVVMRRNGMPILLVGLIVAIPVNLFLMQFDYGDDASPREISRYFRMMRFIEIFVGVLSTLAIARIVEATVEGRRISFVEAARHAVFRWFPGILTEILASIIVALLLLLLIVPGLIWLGFYVFAIIVTSVRSRSGLEALRYSKELVRGQWWHVVLFTIGFILLTVIPGTAVGMATAAIGGGGKVVTFFSDITFDVLMTFSEVCITILFLNLDFLRIDSPR